MEIIYQKRYIDHHRFTESELSTIGERAKNAEYVVTTEKDAVRIEKNAVFSEKLYFLRVEIKFIENEAEIEKSIGELFVEKRGTD